MEKVITIIDWYDGPLCGLTTFEESICIYERIFDEAGDDWSNEYYLTPIDHDSVKLLLREWNIWCKKIQTGDYFDNCSSDNKDLYSNIVESSTQKRVYRRSAVFYGHYGKGYIPIDYCVNFSFTEKIAEK